jgi:hypothetical protein
MGDKGYAALMADVLDPQHKLFVGRVVSAVSESGVCMSQKQQQAPWMWRGVPPSTQACPAHCRGLPTPMTMLTV